jgi:hypothetical protein
MPQSIRWKRAAEGEGFRSVGAWLAEAADAYLRVRARAGQPLPLAWRHGRFLVALEGGDEVMMPGFVSPPFGAFRGTIAGRGLNACKRYTLVHLPTRQIIATLRFLTQCKALAADLASSHARDASAVERMVYRHKIEST